MNWHQKGGAAFPIPHSNDPGAYEAETGMSLRDWFAGQALAALGGVQFPENTKRASMSVARMAYEVADAMIEAREAAR